MLTLPERLHQPLNLPGRQHVFSRFPRQRWDEPAKIEALLDSAAGGGMTVMSGGPLCFPGTHCYRTVQVEPWRGLDLITCDITADITRFVSEAREDGRCRDDRENSKTYMYKPLNENKVWYNPTRETERQIE